MATRAISMLLTVIMLGCGGDIGDQAQDAAGQDDANDDSDAAAGSDARSAECEAPDMLLLVDRTMSMHKTPTGDVPSNDPAGHAESKWALAIGSLEAVTSELESYLRFGLVLFPRDPGGDVCVTLGERIGGQTASNPQCEAGESVVPVAVGSAAAIDAALEVETTLLCRSTPIGAGLETARTELAAIASDDRDQYVVLVTDGQDTCDDPLVIATAQGLRADGVRVYAIGFDGSGGNGVDAALLNDVACAGGTAPDFPAGCTDAGGGAYVATDRTGPTLFHLADDAEALTATLSELASEVCCGCID